MWAMNWWGAGLKMKQESGGDISKYFKLAKQMLILNQPLIGSNRKNSILFK